MHPDEESWAEESLFRFVFHATICSILGLQSVTYGVRASFWKWNSRAAELPNASTAAMQ